MFDVSPSSRSGHNPSARTRSRHIIAAALVLAGTLPATALGQGTIEAWGWDLFNQVTDTPAGAGFTQVARGHGHSLALRADGSIAAWGLDTFGQVSNTPVGTGFVQVAGGGAHSLALRANGSIVSWGSDGGLGGGQVSDTPPGTGFTQIAGGGGHSLALRVNGSIASWGEDTFGQVSATPNGTGYTYVAAGRDHSLALRADGSIETWGNGSLGLSSVPAGTGFTHVAGGADHSLAVRANGSIAAWGFDSDGQVSNAPGGTGFIQVSAAQYHSLALRANGSIESWGYDVDGQVSNSPGGTEFTQLALGIGRHSLAIENNYGSGYCFGDGTGSTCPLPCSIQGNLGEGCGNSTGAGGARLTAFGNASFLDDSFGLAVNGMPSGVLGLAVKGSVQQNSGLGIWVGDGLYCTSAQLRSQTIVSGLNGGLSMDDWRNQPFGTFPGAANVGSPTYYQWWYRDTQNTCTGSFFNFSNGWTVTWGP